MVGTLGGADPAGSAAFLFFLDDPATVVGEPPRMLAAAGGLRDGFREVATSLPGDGGDLLPGLAIGDTSAVTASLDAAMKTSALSHLTAVSGANCAVIIALVVLGGAAIGLPRSVRIGAALVVLAGFVVLVTPEPSVLRAAVMASLVLVGMLSGRPARGLPVLGLAVTVLLVIDPWLARNYGFVLSVCATAGLLLLAAPLAHGLSRWLPMPLAVLVAVPAAAQIACQPVLILLTPAIPTYGVVANILAAPAAPIATVLGLLACVTIPWLPTVGVLLAQVAWLPSAWIAAVASFFDSMPGASLPWLGGASGVALAVFFGGLALVTWLLPPGRFRRSRTLATACLALGVAAYAGVAGGEQLRRRLVPPADWVVAACDVGQGDAMLVRSLDQVALIDTGPDADSLEFCLSTLGVNHIDLLILTHFDLDHVGGSGAVIGLVDSVLVGPSAGDEDDRIIHSLAGGGAVVDQVARGDSGTLGDLTFRVLWPPQRAAGVEPGNDASVAVAFTPVAGCASGCVSSIFLGDLGEESQSRMMGAVALDEVDVVKVSHHGSRDQDARLYERLRARVGLIGVGAGNDYGHPTEQTLNVLRSTGTEVVRTDRSGLALVSIRDGELLLWTERTGTDSGAVGAPE
jgi:competence protein ComEC